MTPLYVPPRLWHAKGLTLLGRILLAELACGRNLHPGDLAISLEVKEEHITRTFAKLEEMKLIFRDGPDKDIRISQLGAEYWLPEFAPMWEDVTDIPPAAPAKQPTLTGGAFDCGTETKTNWAQGAMRPRDKDPPPSLRGVKASGSSLASAIVREMQGGYTVPADLFPLLPPEVILAIHRGEPCVPMRLDGKKKLPMVKWTPYKERTPTADELRKWVRQFYRRIWGWGRITGRVSGIIVLDDDGGGWLEKWGLSPHVQTKRGGGHWIGEYPGWHVPTLNSKACPALAEAYPNLDIRADGGLSVICNAKGEYEWLREAKPDPLDLLPQHARRFFGLDEPPKPRPKRESQSISLPLGGDRVEADYLVKRAVEVARCRGRNTGAMWLSSQMRDNGYAEYEAEAAGSAYIGQVPLTDTRGDVDPYTDEEMRRTVAWAFQQPRREPWTKKEGAR